MDDLLIKSKDVTLIEVLDRVLHKGIVIRGDVIISVADVDLVYIGLNVLISSVAKLEQIKGSSIHGPLDHSL